MPSRIVTTNPVCQSICSGACSVEKTVSTTALAAARASPPKARRRCAVQRQVDQRQHFRQQQHAHADDEDEKCVLRAAELQIRRETAHGDVGQVR